MVQALQDPPLCSSTSWRAFSRWNSCNSCRRWPTRSCRSCCAYAPGARRSTLSSAACFSTSCPESSASCSPKRIRTRIFKLYRSPRIDSKESIPPAHVAWRAGTTTVPSPHSWFKNSSSGYIHTVWGVVSAAGSYWSMLVCFHPLSYTNFLQGYRFLYTYISKILGYRDGCVYM